MQATATQENIQTAEISANLKDATVALENFMVETNRSANTFRQKRELTFTNFKTAVINYLDAQKSEGVITGYAANLEQSGVKKMGINIVGTVTLTLGSESNELKVKLKMNDWNYSNATFNAPAETTTEATA